LLENLGSCVFTSFELLDNEDAMRLMAQRYEANKELTRATARLLKYAVSCIGRELAF